MYGVPANIKTEKGIAGIILHLKKLDRPELPGYARKAMPTFTKMPQDEVEAIAKHLLFLKEDWNRR